MFRRILREVRRVLRYPFEDLHDIVVDARRGDTEASRAREAQRYGQESPE